MNLPVPRSADRSATILQICESDLHFLFYFSLFLIAQILAMIEEAAGTMMYESKKQAAQKTIEKKDSKLREINDILNEEITPTLTKLKEERHTYLEFQKVQRELEHLTKLYTAWKFVEAEELSKNANENLDGIQNQVTGVTDQVHGKLCL